MSVQTSPTDKMQSLLKAARQAGSGLPPVERWNPAYCGEMDLVIKRDGSWWHEGRRITRQSLTRLFSTILRKDDDGVHYLVTPVEKIAIEVDEAPFLAVDFEVMGEGADQRLLFTTNFGDVVEAGPERPISVGFDPLTDEPTPLIRVRGRLDALMTRPVFYRLVDLATEETGQWGVWSGGAFFALEPEA